MNQKELVQIFGFYRICKRTQNKVKRRNKERIKCREKEKEAVALKEKMAGGAGGEECGQE